MTEKGMIVKTVGGYFFLADKNQNILQLEIRGRIQDSVYPGDFVLFSREKSVVEKLCPRDNLLKRPPVANVDQIIIVFSFKKPVLELHLLDRFLVMVESSSFRPIIVFNKNDLVEESNILQNVKLYRNIGYSCFTVSVKTGKNINDLKEKIKGHINVMAGPSGTGKSSLINKIIPEAEQEIKEVSKKLQQGKHTTRHVELLPLNNSGWVADTPGFRTLEFSDILPRELPFYFREFSEYMNECKFNMCSHTHEPGCQVKEAVNNNKIAESRYNSYVKLYEQLEEKEEHKYD